MVLVSPAMPPPTAAVLFETWLLVSSSVLLSMVAIAPPAEDAVLLKRVQLVRVRVVLSTCRAPPSTAYK